jgi:hypothetical protein
VMWHDMRCSSCFSRILAPCSLRDTPHEGHLIKRCNEVQLSARNWVMTKALGFQFPQVMSVFT